jgi:hypothetical protein
MLWESCGKPVAFGNFQDLEVFKGCQQPAAMVIQVSKGAKDWDFINKHVPFS